ncbi:MAG: hypothetical protein IPL25_17185 [Saprospiraceae bacterium]|nr:hypothetical protein [Candidatus Vicinibacter affinis]
MLPKLSSLILVVFIFLSIDAQAQKSFIFNSRITGKTQKINSGDYLKIYTKNTNNESYTITGRIRAIDAELIYLESEKSIPLKEIQKIKHMSPGTRRGAIFVTIILSLLFMLLILLISVILSIGSNPRTGSSEYEKQRVGCVAYFTCWSICARVLAFSANYDIMNHFQSDWTMIYDKIP